jgi:hypothetical protein
VARVADGDGGEQAAAEPVRHLTASRWSAPRWYASQNTGPRRGMACLVVCRKASTARRHPGPGGQCVQGEGVPVPVLRRVERGSAGITGLRGGWGGGGHRTRHGQPRLRGAGGGAGGLGLGLDICLPGRVVQDVAPVLPRPESAQMLSARRARRGQP